MKKSAMLPVLALAALLAACSGTQSHDSEPPSESIDPAPTPEPTANQEENMTVIHFTAGSTTVTVNIEEESPVAQDFLSMLPLTVPFEDFHGMESIAYPPREIDISGGEGMTPQVGDLFVYAPWGNFGFFYDTGSLGFSDDLIRIGTTDDIDSITALQGQEVTISAAE